MNIKLIVPCWSSLKKAAQPCFVKSLQELDCSGFNIKICPSVHSLLSCARNSGVSNSNKIHQIISEYDYYLFVDADTGFTTENIWSLIDLNVPIVGGGYRFREGDLKEHFVAGWWKQNKHGLKESCINKDETRLIKVDWTGGGFVLIKSEVFSQLEYPWFYYGVINDGDESFEHSEDMGLCIKCAKANIPIFCHCGLNLKHEQIND